MTGTCFISTAGETLAVLPKNLGISLRYTPRVTGYSMSPDYLNGDIVLIDYALQPRDGDVVQH